MTMPTTSLANAHPRKSFFVQMFTKDISLEDCILDLIDNSIDGLMRTHNIPLSAITNQIFSPDPMKQGGNLGTIFVNYNETQVEVKDNCGGIDYDYAMSDVFNFGHDAIRRPEDKSYLGVYGIGLKRALFKIGDFFSIRSQTKKNGFLCKLRVSDWIKKDATLDDWKIPLSKMVAAVRPNVAGTHINITDLHPEVVTRLKDGTVGFNLEHSISRTYSFFLGRYVHIKINGKSVAPFVPPLGRPRHGEVSFEKLEEKIGNEIVTVRILATLASYDHGTRPSQENAGWYIVCNGRVVLAADKSRDSGWGEGTFPIWHSKYTSFLGFTFFNSENPLLLPWTTTKRDLNKESTVFLRVRTKMQIAARPVVAFCAKKYERQANPDDEPIEREISKEVSTASFEQLSVKSAVFRAQTAVKKNEKPTVRVQYDALKADLDKIKKHQRNPGMTASEIGRLTLDYFIEQEGL